MKKIISNIAIVLLAISGTACSLDTESMSSIDSQTYYKTMADAKAALVGCYDGYRRTASGGPSPSFFEASEIMGDDCFGATGNGDGRGYQVVDRFDQSQSPADMNLFETLWKLYYAGIFNANSLIVQLDNIAWEASPEFNTSSPEETRAAVEGEARFLRAVQYFDLVRLFERVPLLIEPSKEIVPQAEADATYSQIFADLKFAAENIKYNPTKEWHAANDGRATAEAAKAMLARVYLYYTGYYGKQPADLTKDDVITGLEDIVNGGNYGLVQASENNGFSRMWRAAVATDKGDGQGLDYHDWVGIGCKESDVNEYVFTMKFNYTQDYNGVTTGNRWLVMVGLRGISNVCAVPYGKGWGACTVNPDAWNVFEAGDARQASTIIDIAGEGRKEMFGEVELADQREYTGYNLKKYIPLSYNVGGQAVPEVQAESTWEGGHDFQISQYQDFVVMRYADVLLMLSELKGDASYMNQVRKRAGLGDVAYSQEAIVAERHREFMGEGLRYWDLLRQGVDYAAKEIAGTWNVLSGNQKDVVTIDAQNIISKRGLCRIPDNQITLSGNVYTQNPGW